MIPLRDNIPSRTVPIINYLMIAICALVFIAQLADQGDGEADEPVVQAAQWTVVDDAGQVERERELAAPRFTPWLTLLTCIFLHGGWMHFLGNMWFLFIFGDNVEDRIGHIGYLLFYLLSGVAASVAHLFSAPSSAVPTIGASGAIAGVMGAYFLLYPRAHVTTLVPILYIIEIVVLPAPIFLGIWFVLQFFQGLWSISSVQTTGVAWWAHIGGFFMGFLVAALLRAVGETRPPVERTRPNTDRITAYRYGR